MPGVIRCPGCGGLLTAVHWRPDGKVRAIECANGCQVTDGWTPPDWWREHPEED